MPVVINGSTGISGADGSAATPAYQGTDTNTGVFFPAADIIAFAEGGVEAMRLDASGNVNIATTGKAQKLYVNGNAAMNIATLTDGATITPNFGAANNFTVTLGGNRTLANPTSVEPGQSGVIFVVQDATGSRTLAYGSAWDWPNGAAPSLTTTANAVDVIVYTVRTSTSIAAQFVSNIG